jgi:two-component system, cell cycle sensor histidine kinase and response regulator CckA
MTGQRRLLLLAAILTTIGTSSITLVLALLCRSSFLMVGVLTASPAIVFIAVGTVLFLRITSFISSELQESEERLHDLESLVERLKVTGLIASHVAHDFNNLLCPLIAYPDMIRAELPEYHSTLPYLEDIERAAVRINDMNRQLLTLGRREQHKMEPMDINDIVRDVIKEFRPLPEELNFDLILCGNLASVMGSDSQIYRAVSNLVHNAFDATGVAGHIVIKTENCSAEDMRTLHHKVPAGEYVRLTVSDTGCGIPPDILDEIFVPFFSSKRADAKRGSGLGLCVVEAVVKDHGGFIVLCSEVNQGTSFCLYLPATRGPLEELESDYSIAKKENALAVEHCDT